MKSRCIPDEPDERFRAAETSCLIERGRRGAAAEAERGGSRARPRQGAAAAEAWRVGGSRWWKFAAEEGYENGRDCSCLKTLTTSLL
ncbi:uncharacterized protein DS421_17g597440 [Arachis hypogaea]|nr:uncharacterized protein DS421_17g597440 [Arachis hypogaea]